MAQKSVIIIMGPPGSGKGTQAEILSRKFGYYYLESSTIIDAKFANMKKGDFEIVNGKKYSFAQQKKIREEGEIMDTELVTSWMMEKMKEIAEEGKKMVIAGSPRMLYEAEKEMPLLAELYGKKNIITVLINLSEKDSIFRSANRRICSLVRHPILYYEETKNLTICPLDGSKLLKREDDDAETVKIRLEKYREKTFPIIDYLKKEEYELKEVMGRDTPAELHNNILEILDNDKD